MCNLFTCNVVNLASLAVCIVLILFSVMLQLQPLTPLVDEFASRLFGELDYVQEGLSAEKFQVGGTLFCLVDHNCTCHNCFMAERDFLLLKRPLISHAVLSFQYVGLLERVDCQVLLESFSVSLCSLWASGTGLY